MSWNLETLGAANGTLAPGDIGLLRFIRGRGRWIANVGLINQEFRLASALLFLRIRGFNMVRVLVLAEFRETLKASGHKSRGMRLHRVQHRRCKPQAAHRK